jgi:hypothetical protein
MNKLFAETAEQRVLRRAREAGTLRPTGTQKPRPNRKSHSGRTPLGVARRWDRQRNRSSRTGVIMDDNPMAANNPTYGDRAEIVDPSTGKMTGFRINSK